jgi:uncharacterized repeat protein (TIGR03803 family)
MKRVMFWAVCVVMALAAGLTFRARADDEKFSTLYTFDPLDPVTFASPHGSQAYNLPVVADNAVYGGVFNGGIYTDGVLYRFDLESHQYTLLHTFSAVDANGANEDGAGPGAALTRGPHDVFYGTATYGGKYGSGTIFKITAAGEYTVLHTFSATDANGNNQDGAYPLRTIVIGKDGNLYGTTRIGGEHTCGVVPFPNGCGVAWTMDRSGGNFKVLHQFTPNEGHVASLLQARDGLFYGSAVWPATSLLNGTPLPSGILFRMTPSGSFEELYRFSQTDAHGANADGADCYEPLVETQPGVFYGAATYGGTKGSGVVFRYSLSKPGMVEIVHEFSGVNAAGANADGANPSARLTLGEDGTMYSTATSGGANGNGVVYRLRPDGDFKVLHTFSATDPTTGANKDGAGPQSGVVLGEDTGLIGTTFAGGTGSSGGINLTGGTLYQVRLDD